MGDRLMNTYLKHIFDRHYQTLTWWYATLLRKTNSMYGFGFLKQYMVLVNETERSVHVRNWTFAFAMYLGLFKTFVIECHKYVTFKTRYMLNLKRLSLPRKLVLLVGIVLWPKIDDIFWRKLLQKIGQDN